MRKFIGILIITTSMLICQSQLVAHAAGTNAKRAKVEVNLLNVRTGPSLKHNIIAHVTAGDTFLVLDERFGWLKIKISGDRTGWIASQFTREIEQKTDSNAKSKFSSLHSSVTMLYNGTNLRSGPSIDYKVVAQASQGDQFSVIGKKNNWYHIQLPNKEKAYVASWIVIAAKKETHVLSGKTIVIDPGHGGSDSGAIGFGNQVKEKYLTLLTGKELAQKFRKAGAHVILTRKNDIFLSLQERVNIAERDKADAFISIHYNASPISRAKGITSYYYTKRKDRPLASAIQEMLAKETDRCNRGVHFANYHVLRENSRPSTLLELGFLTNQWEEHIVSTSSYQNTVTTAIVDGVENYFQGN